MAPRPSAMWLTFWHNFVGITRCYVNGRATATQHTDPYQNFKMHETSTAHQHHQYRKKLDAVLHDPPEHELVINLPSRVKIEPVVSLILSSFSGFRNAFGNPTIVRLLIGLLLGRNISHRACNIHQLQSLQQGNLRQIL